MQAFHTLFSKPTFNKNQEFFMEDYKLLLMILSALEWKKNNGKIKLVGDKKSLTFIKKNKLSFIWDFDLEEIYEENIDYNIFWAGSKIYALKKQKSPIVMLDLDFIVWENMENLLENEQIVAIHNEPIKKEIYKNKEYFCMKSQYEFDEKLNWSVLPSNTALLYIKDDNFKNIYCDKAIDFMTNIISNCKDTLSYMVFAEQRLLSMCAYMNGIDIKYLMNYPDDLMNQKKFTHLWGYKNVLSDNEIQKNKLCKNFVNRILLDFPCESVLLIYNDFFIKYI